MNTDKIVKITEPSEKTHWSLWRVIFEESNGIQYPADMNGDDFKLLMKFRELKDKGFSIKDLEEFKDLVEIVAYRNHNE